MATEISRGPVELPVQKPEYRCCGCGYGAVAAAPPPACPMCHRGSWAHADSRVDDPLTVKRLGGSTFLVTPPRELDPEAGLLLSETLADLAHEQPEVVVDLSRVTGIDDRMAQLLLRLGALAHGSGGRLLAVCPTGKPSAVEIREIDARGDDALDGFPGPLGRALRRRQR